MSNSSPAPRFIFHPEAPDSRIPLAAVAGDLVFYGGGVAAHPLKGVPEGIKAFDGYPNHWSQVNRELYYIYDVMARVHEDAGSSLHQLLKINSCHTDEKDVYEALRLRPVFFGKTPPPSTLVLAPELTVRSAKVAVDSIALLTNSAQPRQALTQSTDNAPMPPHQKIWGDTIYSKATKGGGFIFTSGRTNNVIGGASDHVLKGHPDLPYQYDHAESSCRLMLDYLLDVLQSYGASFSHVVKAEIHLNDMSQIAAIERVWKDVFADEPPARIFIPSTFPTPYSTIEIEFIAIDPNGPWSKTTYPLIQHGKSPFCEPFAIKAGPYLFFSGLSATDYEHGLAPEAKLSSAFPFHENAVYKELAYIKQTLKKHVGDFTPLRCKFMSTRLEDYGAFQNAWEREFSITAPTTAFKTLGPLPIPDTSFQLDLIGWQPT
ncbi:RidA family protein [Paenalcaligenes niemegkensis]|uniref:RidA family protein n=1 Tax=Paenalcaligenes niemegkensis TaxID=2895469 RepID=UPI001EE8DE1E|nr:RidA family protein [Paenalcaligenes niemegkensis]MCQ9618284.1 RidA family protein [Paenalcaligenes niemegkensis]